MTTNHKAHGDNLNLTAFALGQTDEAERVELERQLSHADDRTLKIVQHSRRLAEEVRAALAAGNPAPSSSLRDTLRHRLRGVPMDEKIELTKQPFARGISVRWLVTGLVAASIGALLLTVWTKSWRSDETTLAQNTAPETSSRRGDHWYESPSSDGDAYVKLSEGRPPAAEELSKSMANAQEFEKGRSSQPSTTTWGTSSSGIRNGDSEVKMVGELLADQSPGSRGTPSARGEKVQRGADPAAVSGAYPGAGAGAGMAPHFPSAANARNWKYSYGEQGQANHGRSPDQGRRLGRSEPASGNAEHNFADLYGAAGGEGVPGAVRGRSDGQAGGMRDTMGMSPGVEMPGGMGGGGFGGADYDMLPGAGSAEQYAPIVENDFIPVQGQAALSTFSIDVDTASYANVRRFLTQGQLPPPNAVRLEELVNYFRYDYPQPKPGEPFSVNMEMTECPWQPQHLLLRVGLKGQEIHQKERPVSNLVFLLDVSGSMADENKLPLVKQALSMLVRELREDDRVSIVTYAGEAGLRLPPTTGDQQAKILAAIDSLSAGGSTNGSAGINLAYEQAQAYFRKDGTNRVILATDGDLNVGITDDEALVKLIQEKAAHGTFLTVLGFGDGNLKDAKMERLADNGNGMYAYIDSLREGRKVLLEQMSGSLVTIAKDVKLQIEFNPREVQSYRLLGYENRLLTAEEFDDDKRDAGEIGAGHSVTALYELKPMQPLIAAIVPQEQEPLKYQLDQAPPKRDFLGFRLSEAAVSGEILTLKLRYKEPDGQQSKFSEYPLKDRGGKFSAASKDLQFASAVASFGMVLRNSQYRSESNLAAVAEIAASSIGEDQGGYRAEFVDLVRKAQSLGVK